MDERVRLVKSPNGMFEFRIKHADMHEMGEHAAAAEIVDRGFKEHELGRAQNMKYHGYWKVPVRKTGDNE